MGKASSRKKIARRSPRVRVQRKMLTTWNLTVTGVVLVGLLLIAVSRNDDDLYGTPAGLVGPSADAQDHWHAAYGVNLCGIWQPLIPEYESSVGIHSHGDGLIHMHPFDDRGAFENATVEHFLDPPQGEGLAGAPDTPLRYEFNPGQIKAKGDGLVIVGTEGDTPIETTTYPTVPPTTVPTATATTATATVPATATATTAAGATTTTADGESLGASIDGHARVHAQAASTSTTGAATTATTTAGTGATTATTAAGTPVTTPTTAATTEIKDSATFTNGDECPNLGGREGTLRWAVAVYEPSLQGYSQGPVEQEGDPARYVAKNHEVVTIAFLPDDVPLGVPPSAAAALQGNFVNPVDGGEAGTVVTTPTLPLPGETTVPGETTIPADPTATTAGGSTTPSGATTAPAGAASTTRAAGTTTTARPTTTTA